MGPSLTLSDDLISSVAAKITTARRMHGADSTYAIGLFAGLDWLFEGGSADGVRQRLRDRVLEMEGDPELATAVPQTVAADPKSSVVAEGGLVENAWVKGAVKWFNNDKGYGFISTESDTDVFVHWRDISSWDRSLGQGDEVEFMVTKTAKGYQAVNVMKSDKPSSSTDSDTADRVDVQKGEVSADEAGGVEAVGNDAAANEESAEQSSDPAESPRTWNEADSTASGEAPVDADIADATPAAAEGSAIDQENPAASEPDEPNEETAPAAHATDAVENQTSDQDS